MMRVPLAPAILDIAVLPYAHLEHLTDDRGVFEHALGDEPRVEHGYCVDDVARALLVITREPRPTPGLKAMARTFLRFLEDAVTPDGRAHNRMDAHGRWTDAPGVGDWWGRALWALGTSAARHPSPAVRARSLKAFLSLARQRSRDVRAMGFAAIGAGELMLAGHAAPRIRTLLTDAAAGIPTTPAPSWAWPEPRLSYANGSLPEAMLVAGRALSDPALEARGLSTLAALVEIESSGGHLSVTGTAGRAPEDASPLFDQQPIEPAAIADAAARAFDLTQDARWRGAVERSWAWFLGDNDTGVPMIDPATGAGFDGLESRGRNDNRGAESTLAALSTWQQARRLALIGGTR
jgi:hypothetical protein